MSYSNRTTNARQSIKRLFLGVASVPLLMGIGLVDAGATEPCDDFDECKALIEINASDGDIGFHWLVDAEDLRSISIRDSRRKLVYMNFGFGPLREQKMTETFGESSEPLCWEDPEADEEELENIVTLEEFLERWASGAYTIRGRAEGGEKLYGETPLTYELPAAPAEVGFDGTEVFWEPGEDLGNCADSAYLQQLVWDGVLPVHPADVQVDTYEVVVEPEVDEEEPGAALINSRVLSVRVPGDTTSVSVPQEYLLSLGDGTPVKVEVGAIGGEDNGTFTEEDGFCVSIDGEEAGVEECPEESEDE